MKVEMGSHRKEPQSFLGQELSQRAINAGDLDIFDHVVTAMGDSSLSVVERANAFRAVRFGLVGVAVEGWQTAITKIDGDKKPFGNGELAYAFIPNNFFPPHDNTLIDNRCKPGIDIVNKTQGGFALDTTYSGLRDSMKHYLSDSAAAVNGIKMSSVTNN